jgi:hypothetical protein
MEVSECTFNFTTFNDAMGPGANTTHGEMKIISGTVFGDISINFNTFFNGSNSQMMAYLLAHESIHALGDSNKPQTENSYFEEIVACKNADTYLQKSDYSLLKYNAFNFDPSFTNFCGEVDVISSFLGQSLLTRLVELPDGANNTFDQFLNIINLNGFNNVPSALPKTGTGNDDDYMNYLLTLLSINQGSDE